jgi:hypothetical protein
VLDRIENRAFPAKQANQRPLAPGESCETAAGACKILRLTPSGLRQGKGAVDSSRLSAYDVGRGRITGAIACFSVGAVLLARAGCYNTFIAHIACSTPRRPPCSVDVRACQQAAQLSSERPVKPSEPTAPLF